MVESSLAFGKDDFIPSMTKDQKQIGMDPFSVG